MKTRPERIVCVVLALALIAGSVWLVLGSRKAMRALSTPALSGGAYQAGSLTLPDAATSAKWSAPKAQARGPEWVYDVFTPPEIFYDPDKQTFSVKSQLPPAVEKPVVAPDSEPTLLAVRRADFPLQLLGYLGEGKDALGLFENRISSETLLLRAGDRVADLGLTIAEFRVERVAIEIPDSMTVYEPQAMAVARDVNGGNVVLRQGLVTPGEGLIARIETSAGTLDLAEGDEFAHGATKYKIQKIRLAPASVDVTKDSPSTSAGETITLNAATVPTQP